MSDRSLPAAAASYIRWFRDVGLADVPLVGGKNASLGELSRMGTATGVRVPDGFAVTAEAYRDQLAIGGLGQRVAGRLRGIDGTDLEALAAAGADLRAWVEEAP